MGVDYCSLYIIQVGVVFESPLEKPCFLAQLGNVRLVIIGEHLIAHNRIRYLQLETRLF